MRGSVSTGMGDNRVGLVGEGGTADEQFKTADPEARLPGAGADAGRSGGPDRGRKADGGTGAGTGGGRVPGRAEPGSRLLTRECRAVDSGSARNRARRVAGLAGAFALSVVAVVVGNWL